MVDHLVKAKIPKQTAKELIDYVEAKQTGKKIVFLEKRLDKVENSLGWLKWLMEAIERK